MKWELQTSTTFNWDIASRINFFDPIGLTFLAGLIEKQLSKSVSGSITFNSDIMNYLERINFLEYLESYFSDRLTIMPVRPEIRRKPLKERLLEFDKKLFRDKTDIEQCIKHLSELCQERIGDSISFMYIDDVFGELLSNVEVHSGAKAFFVVAQKYPAWDLIKISISDLGVGIPVKIRSKYSNISSDTEAINLATESGVTTASMGGLGLTTLKDYLVDPEDYLFIAPNNGCVKYERNKTFYCKNYAANFTGTFIEVCFKSYSKYRRAIQDIDVPF